MIVQCPECTTKYNLDESKIGHDGTKVRCARCKNVFTVFRPTPDKTAEPAPPVKQAPAAPAPQSPAEDFLEDDFGGMFTQPASGHASTPAVGKSLDDDFEDLFKDTPSKPAAGQAAD